MQTKQLYENNQPFYPKTPIANVINIGGGGNAVIKDNIFIVEMGDHLYDFGGDGSGRAYEIKLYLNGSEIHASDINSNDELMELIKNIGRLNPTIGYLHKGEGNDDYYDFGPLGESSKYVMGINNVYNYSYIGKLDNIDIAIIEGFIWEVYNGHNYFTTNYEKYKST